ncbi:hypothetical protein R50073_38780 [Maricurvus nonylphenolicus]|uniref:TonB family protein n=1 Tax=Maricurvus nonylphenolicus TaxID=1008307 RepID=UPI0036F3731D
MTSLGLRLPSRAHAMITALLIAFTTPVWAEPLINGIASHSEFNKERFIAALYSETLSSDANAIIQASEAKRLELRITTRRLSARRLNNMWIEGMAINNSGATLSEQAQNMVAFTGLIKQKLVAGDHVVIDSKPGFGTTVSVNGTELGNIASDDFFNLLLRTWIGNVPLSSDFRAALLTEGDVDAELLGRFESTQPSDARRQAVAAWTAPAQPKPEAKPAPVAIAAAPQEVAKPAISAPALAQAPTLAQPELAAPAVAEPEVAAEESPAAEAAVAEEVAAAEEEAIMSEDEVFGDEPLTDEEALLDEEDEDAEAPLLTAESLLSRQLYHSKLLKWTYKYIRYPKRAVSRGHEGSVRLNVTIDREGNVQNVAEMENSRHSTLNKEALKAVERATPFPPVPEDVTGEAFEFSLPIVFRLPK